MKQWCLIVAAVAACVSGVAGAVIEIPVDYGSIQAGIDASTAGDTVLVADGIYYERIRIVGHSVTVASQYVMDGDTMHIANTVIDADTAVLGVVDTACAMLIANADGYDIEVKGLTIRNGLGVVFSGNYRNGAGIHCETASPRIVRNIIEENELDGGYGAAIYCTNSQAHIDSNTIRLNSVTGGSGAGIAVVGGVPWIEDNRFEQNSSANYGGALMVSGSNCRINRNRFVENHGARGTVYLSSCSPIIKACVFENNRFYSWPGAAIACDQAHPTVANCVFNGNQTVHNGGAIGCTDSHPEIINCVFHDNEASNTQPAYGNGGAIYCDNSAASIVNCIFVSNTASNQEQDIYTAGAATPTVTYSRIEGSWSSGTGNTDAAPLFLDTAGGDFHLMSMGCGQGQNSPCIDAGDPTVLDHLLHCDYGLGLERSDMGAYGGGDAVSTVVDDAAATLPASPYLAQNYPNPFNPTTTIEFDLPRRSRVRLSIYNLLGREVARVVDRVLPPGYHRITWDGRSDSGERVSTGVYFYRIEAGACAQTRKMVLLK